MTKVVENLTPPIPDAITPEWLREEFLRLRAWQKHVDEALHRFSSIPPRVAELEGTKMCASAAAHAFNHLALTHQEGLAGVHGRLDVVEPAVATLAPEALPEVAARIAAAAESA